MNYSNDHEWLDWVVVQKKALKLKIEGHMEDAIEAITEFLSLQPPPDLRCDALHFRSMIEEEQGALDLAKTDRQRARLLAPSGSYTKYTLELGLASLHESVGEVEEAIAWYISALETVIKDRTTSGASAVAGLLALTKFSALNDRHRELCISVIKQAWDLFQLPGEPDLSDLRKMALVLLDASSRPLPRS